MADQSLNGLFERLRQQTGQSAAPNPKTGSPSNMPPLQQYPRPTERASSTYTNDPSFFPQYQYGQLPTKSQTPPTYNPPIPTVSSSQTDPNKAASLLGILRFTQAAPAGPQGSTMPIPREAILSPPPLGQSGISHSPSTGATQSRSTNGQDLVASLSAQLGQTGASVSAEQHAQPPYTSSSTAGSEVAAGTRSSASTLLNPQDLVLQLFNKGKPTQSDQVQTASVESSGTEKPYVAEAVSSQFDIPRGVEATNSSEPQVNRTPSPNVGSSNPVTSTVSANSPHATGSQAAPASYIPSNSGPNKPIFTYVNPFDQFNHLTPKLRTPKQTNSPGPNGIKRPVIPSPVNPIEVPLPSSPKADNSSPVDDVDVFQQIDMRLKAQIEKRAEETKKADSELPEPQGNYLEPVDKSEAGDHEGQQSTSTTGGDSELSRDLSTKEEPGSQEIPTELLASSDVMDRDEGEETDYIEPQEPIKVYNFPMKPFSAITIHPNIPDSFRPRFPVGKMLDIARMPRQFDQLDRNLIAATTSYIVYAISKSNGRGGIRVLRQEDGKDRVLNKDTMDRTFNVVIGRGDRILGTAISGAVLWADIGEGFENGDWQNHSFIFPPSEEQGQTSGVLKSRARKSCRHIDVFAIGRGKTINIIHAPTAKEYSQGRKGDEVASKKYLADHSRIIDTGKASKDFCFSEDDTVIISIDKAGKLKLWDVQALVEFGGPYTSGQAATVLQPPMLLSIPAMVLSAVAAGESYRATSVMFLDKHRPFHKSLALRYVIVGMKQNHTLQLWDLALGRPVQEIHFPQSSDTDALCSVAYHPLTGIVVVGNPTRNSIYFIHLSAPKYNLPPQSQAQYIKNLASRSNSIPRPDATAILSGLREYSFASKGQLMSLDILDTPQDVEDGEPTPLFELYVAHSKGMTSLNVYKEDLGWDNECKTKHSVDAVFAKICKIGPMPQPQPPPVAEPEPSTAVSPVPAPTPDGIKPVQGTKEHTRRRSPSPVQAPPSGTPIKSEKSEKFEKSEPSVANSQGSRKKKGGQKQQPQSSELVQEKLTLEKAQRSKLPVPTATSVVPTTVTESQSSVALTSAVLEREVKKIETSVTSEFARIFSTELDRLYKSLSEDRRVQQAAGDAKQEALLKLLSSTLTENVEKVLADIVVRNIEQQVVPTLTSATSQSIERHLSSAIEGALGQLLPTELRTALPDIVKRVISSPDVLGKINETVGKTLAVQLTGTIERELSRFLHGSIFPALQQLALDTAHKVVAEVDAKHNTAFTSLQNIQQQDSRKVDALVVSQQHESRKMDQLVNMVQSLTESVSAMSRAQGDISRVQVEMIRTQVEISRAQQDMIKQQTEFQEQVQKAQADWMQGQNWPEEEDASAQDASRPTQVPQVPQPTPQQIEHDEIDALFRGGRYEQATIRWLQSKDRQEELFDEVVRRYRYDFMPALSQLVLLSVSAAVTVNFENSVQDRTNWLEGVLSVLNPRDPEIAEICSRIMAVVVQRLEQSYMRISERDPSEPALRKIPALAKKARELGSLD